MKHRHHLKPKHAGGEDREDNLTPPIPIIRHAMFHWCEWKRTENEFDRIAWLSLTGQIDRDGVKQKVLREAGLRRAAVTKEKRELFLTLLGNLSKERKEPLKIWKLIGISSLNDLEITSLFNCKKEPIPFRTLTEAGVKVSPLSVPLRLK